MLRASRSSTNSQFTSTGAFLAEAYRLLVAELIGEIAGEYFSKVNTIFRNHNINLYHCNVSRHLKIDAYSKAADLSNAHQAHEHFNQFQGQMWVNIPYMELLEKTHRITNNHGIYLGNTRRDQMSKKTRFVLPQ